MHTWHELAVNSSTRDVDQAPYTRSFSAIFIPILAFLSCVLCVPPLILHVKSRNLAASVLIFWIAILNIFNFINPLIWPTDDTSSWWKGYGLCDIEIKFELAASVAYIGALVCIYRRLAIILDTDQVTLMASPAQQRRRLAFEIIFCFGLPIYLMVIHYIVQPSRYYIYAIGGCTPSFDNSWPSIVLVFMWPPIVWLLAAGYCILVIYRLLRYRQQLSGILASSSSSVNKSTFVRLFVMATTLILFFLPLAFYIFYRDLAYPRHAYSWHEIHYGPAWDSIPLVTMDGTVSFDRWIQVATGYIAFLSFGFGRDAVAMYQQCFSKTGLDKVSSKLKSLVSSSTGSRSQSSPRNSFPTHVSSFGSRTRPIFRSTFTAGRQRAPTPFRWPNWLHWKAFGSSRRAQQESISMTPFAESSAEPKATWSNDEPNLSMRTGSGEERKVHGDEEQTIQVI